jgi:hypothetical protein
VDYLNGPNPSGRTMALGSTQPLNRNEYQESLKNKETWGYKVRPARRVDNLAAIY